MPVLSGLFTSILTDNSFTLPIYLLCAAVSVVCGIITAFSASFKNRISKGFFVSLITLPFIVLTVILMVNGSIGTGVAVMGAFSLIRFRSAPAKAKDICAIFASMTSGLICAAGYLDIAVFFTVIFSVITIILNAVSFKSERTLDLRITIPESLNYSDAFNDIFEKYTASSRLVAVKTTDMGSLYKLTYKIIMKNSSMSKDFIDELRCRNGNLEIMISDSVTDPEEL